MHWNFPFTAVQILWILTFAAHLVLLVVLLGRERTKRFPWFTASIALAALRLVSSRLLYGRIPQITMGEIFITMADISAVIDVLVVVEMARRGFKGAQKKWWITFTASLLIVGGGVLFFWGPWPQWKAVTANGLLAHLTLMQVMAQKMTLLTDVLTIGLGVLVLLLGRRFGSSWHSHVQRIVIGLMTAAISQLALQGIRGWIAKNAMPHSQAEYERLIGLFDKLMNANNAVYLLVLVWWIVCLWIEDPGEKATAQAALDSNIASTKGSDLQGSSAGEQAHS
ncbi:MAG: hypothetical protein KGN79_02450 [Acidobacteriota bacterium]|nr:hypothetical protein [Acidobacteriota bacterium]